MQRRSFLVAAASLPAAASMAPATTSAEDDALARTLLRLENERQAAYVEGDRDLLERQLAAEYVHTNLRGGRADRDSELDFYEPGTFSLSAGRTENIRVHRYDNVATLTGTVIWENAIYRPTASVAIDLSGHFSVSRVYVYRDARWQLALSHASQVQPNAT